MRQTEAVAGVVAATAVETYSVFLLVIDARLHLAMSVHQYVGPSITFLSGAPAQPSATGLPCIWPSFLKKENRNQL